MIDIIYKTVKLSHLKQLQVIQKIKYLMFQAIFVFSDWILIKKIIVSSGPFCCWRKQIFKKMLPGGMSNFALPRAWWKEPGGEFWVGRDMSKNVSNQCIFYECELHNSKTFFPHIVEYKCLRENSTSILEKEIKP